MPNITSILPLPLDVMKQVVTSTDAYINIDYAASKIKGRAALIYLTNANIPNVTFTVTDNNDAFELIDSYIMHKSTVNIACLCASVIRILMAVKGITLGAVDENAIDNLSLITPNEVSDYLMDDTRRDHVIRLIHLFDNIPTCLVVTSPAYVAAHGEPETTIPTIDSIDYIGYTFVNLLQLELFTLAYFSVPTTSPVLFFRQQFKEYAYVGKNLFAYLSNTFIVPILGAVQDGTVDATELHKYASQ